MWRVGEQALCLLYDSLDEAGRVRYQNALSPANASQYAAVNAEGGETALEAGAMGKGVRTTDPEVERVGHLAVPRNQQVGREAVLVADGDADVRHPLQRRRRSRHL